MKSILDVLTLSTAYLKDKGIKNPRRQAEELLSDALLIPRLDLYLNFDRPLTEQELILCRERLARRGKGEPLAYIHGKVSFYDCELVITSAVLIPRPETEILVDKIVHQLDQQEIKGKVLWDLCCGSGCIGIALKKRFPELRVILSDLSSEALDIAKQNAKHNDVEIEWRQGDLFEPFEGQKAHYIVSNPPYISENEFAALDKEVRLFEPRMALVAGETGLEIYRRFAEKSGKYLEAGGKLWLEIGYLQGKALMELFQRSPWKEVKFQKDRCRNER